MHLAMIHLNTGDGSVIPDVVGLNERCSLRFTKELSDTEIGKPQLFKNWSAVTMPMSIISGVTGYLKCWGSPFPVS